MPTLQWCVLMNSSNATLEFACSVQQFRSLCARLSPMLYGSSERGTSTCLVPVEHVSSFPQALLNAVIHGSLGLSKTSILQVLHFWIIHVGTEHFDRLICDKLLIPRRMIPLVGRASTAADTRTPGYIPPLPAPYVQVFLSSQRRDATYCLRGSIFLWLYYRAKCRGVTPAA